MFRGMLGLLAVLVPVWALSQTGPRIGYAYPAGGKAGTTVEVELGGQSLRNVQSIITSSPQIDATLIRYWRPLGGKEFQLLSDKIAAERAKITGAEVARRLGRRAPDEIVRELGKSAGLTDDEIDSFIQYRKARSDPKAQPNAQLSEKLYLRVEIRPGCEPGNYEIRGKAPNAITNPIRFQVGTDDEIMSSAARSDGDQNVSISAPFVLNGQILPGEVDAYSFSVQKGQRLVIQAAARSLVPYMADAVPGWFQPSLQVLDPLGHVVATSDHDGFNQDPKLIFTAHQDGKYRLVVNDAIYRGREDFVYRVRIGLTAQDVTEVASDAAIDGLAVTASPVKAGLVNLPLKGLAVLSKPGQVDLYRFRGTKGQSIVVETVARRIGSPVDTSIELIDPHGKRVAANDDTPDPAMGRLTNCSDSAIAATLPVAGTYTLRVWDATRGVGSYRMRIGPPEPSFDLRVIPSALVLRPGSATPFDVTVIRRDGYTGPITFETKTPGYRIGGWIPEGANSAKLTLSGPQGGDGSAVYVQADGIGGGVRRPLIAADTMMQAFAYLHMVIAQGWCVANAGRSVSLPQCAPLVPQKLSLQNPTPIVLEFDQVERLRRINLKVTGTGAPASVVSSTVSGARITVMLRLDPKQVKVGQQGNLLLMASLPAVNGGFLLPAVPYEVVP